MEFVKNGEGVKGLRAHRFVLDEAQEYMNVYPNNSIPKDSIYNELLYNTVTKTLMYIEEEKREKANAFLPQSQHLLQSIDLKKVDGSFINKVGCYYQCTGNKNNAIVYF